MKTFTILKNFTPKKEKIISRFGVNFIIKNNKVFLLKKFGPVVYHVLMENDPEYFFKSLNGCNKTKYSSKQFSFILTDKDWDYIRKKTTIIVLPITNRCNSDCKICFMSEGIFYDEMSINDIKNVLSKIGKNKKILLFGGEPTIREDIFEIIELIKKSGNIPTICTNGLKLADNSFVKKLKKSGIERVLFSFDGFREDIYEKLRGKREHLYLKLKALKNLKQFGIKVYLSSTIASGINEDELQNLLKFAAINNDFIIGMNIYPATPYGRFNITIKKYLTPSDIVKMLENVSKGVINKEYVFEFKKLRMNLNRIVSKFGIFFPQYSYYHSHTLLRIENNQIKHFLPIDELKMINELMNEKKYFKLLKILVKNSRLVRNSLIFLLKRFNSEYLGNNILIIQFGNVITPFNHIPVEYDCISIEKSTEYPLNDENKSNLSKRIKLWSLKGSSSGPG